MQRIKNWGNYSAVLGKLNTPNSESEIKKIVKSEDTFIPRGLGRSYGDASLHKNMISSGALHKVVHFDKVNGQIICQCGISIGEILSHIVPHGFFLPVIPGSKTISLGGAIAADVHGKNHNTNGSFSSALNYFDLLISNGEVIRCSKDENQEAYYATIGGMGLSGFIISASISLMRIESSYLINETISTSNLNETLSIFESSKDWKYTVAWMDTTASAEKMGSAIFSRAKHAKSIELPEKLRNEGFSNSSKSRINIPLFFPGILINNFSIKLFNLLYKILNRRKGIKLVHFDSYFFPLDAIQNWNRLYGKSGFLQFQAVFPLAVSRKALSALFSELQKQSLFSSLSVLKYLGDGNEKAPLSFPMKGYTITFDFKVSKKTFELLNSLNDIVKKYNGRIYLAKDATMTPEMLKTTYPLNQFNTLINKLNPTKKFQSSLSNRLDINKNNE